MKYHHRILRNFLELTLILTLVLVSESFSQRMMNNSGAARPASNRPVSGRPSAGNRPTSPAMSRPSSSNSRPQLNTPSRESQSFNRPNTNNSSPRPAPSKPENKPGSLNGGSNRVTKTPAQASKVTTLNPNTREGNRLGNSNSIGSNNRGDVNININNSHNTVIRNNRNVAYRPPYRPYPRPPYIWGGYGFSWFRPYYYHPYTPYYWGPVWHPWGFFITTIAVTAVVVTVHEQQYHYDEGVFYVQADDGYVVVEAPQGATVKVIPKESEVVEVSPTVNNYYYGGTFYEQKDGTYSVVPPPAGATVTNLPEGAEEVKIGDQTFVKFGDTYFMPVEVDGKALYEIVQVEEGEK